MLLFPAVRLSRTLHLISLLGYRCHLLHLNHLLRDVDSNKDQEFVEDLADKLDIPISVQ